MGVALAGVGVAVADTFGGSVTITRDDTVVDSRVIKGYLHIKANNVTIRNSTVRYGGAHAVRVFESYTGAVIEDTKIVCLEAGTNGLVFGNYTALRVTVTGCRNGFMYSEELPATIIDSAVDNQPVVVDMPPSAALRSDPEPASESEQPAGSVSAPSALGKVATGVAARPRVSGASTESRSAEAAGIPTSFPGPTNTGVPAGITLKASGSITVTTDGQVISGLNINGCVTVSAKNVIIRKSRITCSGLYSVRTKNAANLLVEDVEIDGQGKNSAAVCCDDYTLRRVNISNVIDGPRLGDRTVVEYSWIHHLKRQSGSHNDTLQTTGATNIVVRGNTLDAYNPITKDPMNACLQLGSTTGPIVANLIFEQNYCNGGNYSISFDTSLKANKIQLRDNVYGRNHRFGVIARPTHTGILWDNVSNLYLDNRLPVVK